MVMREAFRSALRHTSPGNAHETGWERESVDRLEEMVARLVEATGTDRAEEYIVTARDTGEESPYDGIIRTKVGYFRLCEDVAHDPERHGNKVLLFAFSADDLKTVRNERGAPYLSHKGKCYIVSARNEDVSGRRLREDMQAFIRDMEDIFLYDLSFWIQRIPETGHDGASTGKGRYRIANRRLGIGLREMPDGRWIRTVRPRIGEDSHAFVRLTDDMPRGLRLISCRQSQIFDTQQAAYEDARRIVSETATALWQNRPFTASRTACRSPLSRYAHHAGDFAAKASEKSLRYLFSRAAVPWYIAAAVGSIVNGLGATWAAALTFPRSQQRSSIIQQVEFIDPAPLEAQIGLFCVFAFSCQSLLFLNSAALQKGVSVPASRRILPLLCYICTMTPFSRQF